TNQKVSVGPPYYNLTFIPLMVPLLVAMAVGPLLPWKRGDLAAALQRLKWGFGAAAAAAIATMAGMGVRSLGAACGLGLAGWARGGTLTELGERLRLFAGPPAAVVRRALRQPRASWGMTLAHGGMAIVIAGITGSTAWTEELIVNGKPGQSFDIA